MTSVQPGVMILPWLLLWAPSSWTQVTLWETYQSAGHQAIQDRRVTDAEQLLLAAARNVESVNPEDPRLGNTLNDLGVLYGMKNRDSEAASFLERALMINEKAFGRQHIAVVVTLQNLGVIYAAQQKFVEAHTVTRESQDISLRLFGPNHPRTASTWRTVATVYALQGNLQEADRCIERSIAIFEQTLGERHPETITSLELLARLMWTTDRSEQADQLEVRLETLRRNPIPGSDFTHDVRETIIHRQ